MSSVLRGEVYELPTDIWEVLVVTERHTVRIPILSRAAVEKIERVAAKLAESEDLRKLLREVYEKWRGLVASGITGDIEQFRSIMSELLLALSALFGRVPVPGEVTVYKMGEDKWIVRVLVPEQDYERLFYIEGPQSLLTVLKIVRERCSDLFHSYDTVLKVFRHLADLWYKVRIENISLQERKELKQGLHTYLASIWHEAGEKAEKQHEKRQVVTA